MVDTLRADMLGAYGNTLSPSPEIDSIANKGVIFEKAISQASWTRPSVASLLTSKYPRRLGVMREQWDVLRDDAITLAERFKEEGYLTIGLTANPQLNTVFGFAQGFDQYVDSTVIFSWMKEEEGKQKANKRVRVRNAREILDDALGRLKQPHDNPVFLQLMLMDVHAHALIDEALINDQFKENSDKKYLQAVRNTSREIGRFISELEDNPSLDMQNTLLILTADHGEGLHDHPSVRASHGHGNLLYRSQVHVPLIFYGLGEARLTPRKLSGVIPLLDLYPTVLDLISSKQVSDIDGWSQKNSIINGLPIVSKSEVFTETQWRRKVNKAALVSNDWFYIESRDEWKGTAPIELQQFEGIQDGMITNKAEQEFEKVREFKIRLLNFETSLKDTEPVDSITASVSSNEIQQLKSLGYLGK